MGGVPWSGPVKPEPNEPPFHAEWERRAFAMTLAMAMPGGWNIDMSRFVREDRSPEEYLSKSYYQIWLAGLERLMLERGLIAPDEIGAGKPLHPAKHATNAIEVRVFTCHPRLAIRTPLAPHDAAPPGLRVRGSEVSKENKEREEKRRSRGDFFEGE